MKKGIQLSSILAFFLVSSFAFANTGIIRGTVYEQSSGEPLFGVAVRIQNTATGAVTDFDGKFQIAVEPGTYTLEASFVSFKTVTITDLVVEDEDITLIEAIWMEDAVEELEAIVVTANVLKNTESALLTVKRKSANLLDGINSQTFRKIGASNAASAVTRVPGVSVQGGKYVFVRGLGDRYTKTILNGSEIPGLDPDRNTLQLDIFPTNVLDNIVVLKSFTPELPADFTGGIVNIETKDFPEENTMTISGGVGFNPNFHLQNNYLDYDGSSTDFLGFDAGDRDLPFPSETEIPDAGGVPDLDESRTITNLTRQFDPTFVGEQKTSNPNYNLSFSAGNQKQLGGNRTLGYNVALSYRNTTTFYDSAENVSVWLREPDDAGIFELNQDRSRRGVESSNNTLVGGLAGIALKDDVSKYKLTVLHVQNGERVANVYDETNVIRNTNRSIRNGLAYAERSLTNVQLHGEHFFDGGWNIDWKITPTFSKVNDLDVRLVPFTRSEEGALNIEPSEGGDPTRLWRFLDEQNYAGKLDLVKEFEWRGFSSKLKFGGSYILKERDFSIDNFNFLVINPDEVSLRGDGNNLLIGQNIFQGLDTDGNGIVDNRTGVAVTGSFQASNSYSGSISNLGFYISSELTITEKLRSIFGVRFENYVQRYTGGNQDFFNSDGAQGIFFDDQTVLESFKPFPVASFIYALQEKTNLRFAYSRTIARPSFKEQSIAQIVDPISGTSFIGGISFDQTTGESSELLETDINNFDLRYETFFEGGQTFAVSAFYKTFKNPLEIEVFSAISPSDFTARNNGNAQVFGLELEARKNLGFISSALSDFSMNLNASVIESRLEISEAEIAGRQGQARLGENIDDTRQLQGQSPYLVNAGISYDNFESGWEGGLFFNVQGSALAVVGSGITPDLYNVPFHRLDFTVKRSFGYEQRASIRLRVTNLLNDKIETRFESFQATDRISSSRAPGQTFSLSFSYRLK